MRLYHRSQDDKGWSIARCHFDAEHGRVALALTRLQDLLDEFPNDAKVIYGEGVIRRDFLGQGLIARECFERAYDLEKDHWATAQNATVLSRSEDEFRLWVDRFQKIAPANEPARKFFVDILANLREGMRYWQATGLMSQAAFEAKQFGPSAANLELSLLAGEMTPAEEVSARRTRAQCLRALDKEAHQYHESVGEEFHAEERPALHEAVTEIDKAIELDEYDPELWNLKSAWCLFLDRAEEADRCASRAIELRPFHYPKPYINKAVALENLGRKEEALASIRQALDEAEKIGSATDVTQARRIIEDLSTSLQDATLQDLEEPVIGRILKAVQVTSDLEVGLLPSRSIEKLIKGFTTRAFKVRSDRSIDYVPLVAEVLSDFTPETVFCIVQKTSRYSQKIHDHCLNGALYVVTHSDGVRQRDAARFLALTILSTAKSAEIRRAYRKLILETSAAASDEMSHLDAIMRQEFNRMNGLLPELIADQEPIDEAGREGAVRHIISKLADNLPPSAKSTRQTSKPDLNPNLTDFGFPGIPPPTTAGAIFNMCMLVAPFLGIGVGWLIGKGFGSAIGLFAGMGIACVGWIWFFFIKNHPRTRCAACGRFLAKVPSPVWMEDAEALFSTAAMNAGHEGPGVECVKCASIYCTQCAKVGTTCGCGSTRFRTVRLANR